MKIILKEKVENLGSLGNIVNVRSGYARNYLIPRGKAVQATQSNILSFEKQKSELEKIELNKLKLAQEKATKIDNKLFKIEVMAGESGKLFGSVNAKDIANSIINHGVKIEKRNIRMPESGPIRSLGEYKILISLDSGINANIKLQVVSK